MPTGPSSQAQPRAHVPSPAARAHRFAWITLIAIVLVILWGAFVRVTGSGAGCGSHWPLCNGELVPRAPSAETLIELSHRLTSGVALLMVVALVVIVRRCFPAGHTARRYAYWTLFFMLGEAAVGAGLVLFELVAENASMARAMFMAVHLCNTFLLLGALVLTLDASAEGRGHGRPAWSRLWRGIWRADQHAVRFLGLGLLGCMLLGASGAVAALGDTLFPASSLEEALRQDLAASSHILIRLRLLHPAIALVSAAVLLLLAGAARRDHDAGLAPPRAARLANALTVLVLSQVALGFINVALLAPAAIQLLHLLLADALWIVLVALTAHVLTPGDGAMPRAASAASLIDRHDSPPMGPTPDERPVSAR